MKIILDTNVLISGVFFTGPPYQILKAWRDGKAQLVISEPVNAYVIFYHVISNMHSLLSGISIIKQRRVDHRNLFVRQHYEIYRAIRERDTRAAELSVSVHIDSLIGKNETDKT